MINGLKEKTEKKLLSCLKKVDYYIILEMVYTLDFSFRFYVKKRRLGRRSFKYYNTVVYVSPSQRQQKAISSLFQTIKSFNKSPRNKYVFKEPDLMACISSFIKSKGVFLENKVLSSQKQILLMRSVRHFRWAN